MATTAIFFDDIADNFGRGAAQKCSHLVRHVHCKRGRLHGNVFTQRAWAKELKRAYADLQIQRRPGVSEKTLRKLTKEAHKFHYYVFDWDLTLSAWSELFFDATPDMVAKWRQDGHWHEVRASMLGSPSRVEAMLRLWHTVGHQRVIILSNQEDAVAIRAILRALSVDHPEYASTLRHISIATWQERGRISKHAFMRNLVGPEACARG